jgi:signal peptidase II
MQRRTWPIWYYYAIAIIVFFLDYITKKIVENTMEIGEKIEVLGNFFLLTSIRNRGAAFGILQEQRLFFLVITIIVVAGIIFYLHYSYRKGSRIMLAALGMILGGAVGNFLDRALYGEVVDFLQFNFGSYTFPIFNLADSGICIGVGMVILDSLLSQKREKNNDGEGRQQHGQVHEESGQERQQPV